MPGSGGRRSDSDGGEEMPLLGAVAMSTPLGNNSGSGSGGSSSSVREALMNIAANNGQTSNSTGELEESFLMGTDRATSSSVRLNILQHSSFRITVRAPAFKGTPGYGNQGIS